MKRLVIHYSNIVGLLVPDSLLDSLLLSLTELEARDPHTLPGAPSDLGIGMLKHTRLWIETERDNGGLSPAAVAYLVGVGYDTVLFRLKRDHLTIQRPGHLMVIPPAATLHLAGDRLLLNPPATLSEIGDVHIFPIPRPVMRLLALHWHSLLTPAPWRALGQALVEGAETPIPAARLSAWLERPDTLPQLQEDWDADPRPVIPVRGSAFAGDDLARLGWNHHVVATTPFVWPPEASR